jgi:hypothetical protein
MRGTAPAPAVNARTGGGQLAMHKGQLVANATFPSRPGVYIVWEEGYEHPLYVGQAGSSAEILVLEKATIKDLKPRLNVGGPERVLANSSATIASRWKEQHLKPRAGGSALRRTLGPYLGLVERKLVRRDGRYYPADVEAAITRFLEACSVEFRFVGEPPKVDA